MRIGEIDSAISVCREHINAAGAQGTDIESFLTQYIMIRICANFEERVRVLLSQPFDTISDEYIRALAQHGVRHITQGTKTSDIARMLSRIDPTLRDEFRQRVNGTEKENSFNLIVANRNRTAHERGSDITFDDLINHYEDAHRVLDDLSDAIGTWRNEFVTEDKRE